MSKGFGIDFKNTDNLHNHDNLHRIIFDHLNELYPAPNGVVNASSGPPEGKNGFVNGALGGTGEVSRNNAFGGWRDVELSTSTGTDYFSMCFAEHIPEDVDLVLLELGELERAIILLTNLSWISAINDEL